MLQTHVGFLPPVHAGAVNSFVVVPHTHFIVATRRMASWLEGIGVKRKAVRSALTADEAEMPVKNKNIAAPTHFIEFLPFQ